MSSHFVDHKRGEIDEIRNSLRDIKIKDKRDIIRKVIAYMSLGIDVSKIYSEMVMAANTTDPVQKKMVYHYLCNYAQEKADLAILCINTLQKDSNDSNPMFRGLAIRYLAALRVPNIIEYALSIVRRALSDFSPYVRRTALFGILKLRSFKTKEIVDEVAPDLRQVITGMLKDNDCQVVMNALIALIEFSKTDFQDTESNENVELEEDELFRIGVGMSSLKVHKEFSLEPGMVIYLLSRLTEFSEWGQCLVLELAAKHTPASEDEMYDIMNYLETRLRNANSAVVLATVKVFLHLTYSNPDLLEQVYQRLEAPLITLSCVCPIETAYVVYSHINVISSQSPSVFSSSFKQLFIKDSDIIAVKALKLEILAKIANADNAQEILDELMYFSRDINIELAVKAIKAIGLLAIHSSFVLEDCLNALLDLLDNTSASLLQVIAELRDILRKHPEKYVIIVPALYNQLQKTDILEFIRTDSGNTSKNTTFSTDSNEIEERTNALSALFWIFGELGQELPDAPYMIESVVDALVNKTEGSEMLQPNVLHELLTCCMKQFLKRPHEMRPSLGKLLVYTTDAQLVESGHIDQSVFDRAVLYVNLLQRDISAAAKVVAGARPVVETFWETALALNKTQQGDAPVLTFTEREFNTLSIIYNMPESAFKPLGVLLTMAENVEEVEPEAEEHNDEIDHDGNSSTHQSQQQYDSTAAVTQEEDASGLGLALQPEVTQDDYQALWGSLEGQEIGFGIEPSQAADSASIERALSAARVYTMASGDIGNGTKFFLYSLNVNDMETTDGNPAVYLVEVDILLDGTVQGTLKSNTDEERTNTFYNLFGVTVSSL